MLMSSGERVLLGFKGEFWRGLVRFVVLAMTVWIGLFTIYVTFPNLRSGAEVIYYNKEEYVASRNIFSEKFRYRVVAFGNSKILAGFRPSVFDGSFDGAAQSYNLGLPGESDFLRGLDALLRGGSRPTHVLIQTVWPDARHPPGWLDRIEDSKAINRRLFPFRDLPRDLVLFSFNALRGKGWASQYRDNTAQVDRMIQDRGWYFIEGQSHYANDALPPGYHLATDKPNTTLQRPIYTSSWIFDRLKALALQFQFDVLLIPEPERDGEYAPPPIQSSGTAFRQFSDHPNILAVGPDYILYPPELFSDPIHFNPRGAIQYSRDIATLFGDYLKR